MLTTFRRLKREEEEQETLRERVNERSRLLKNLQAKVSSSVWSRPGRAD